MNKLRYYRKKIDGIDRDLVKLLILRFKLIKQIGSCKKINKIEILDKKRELYVIKNIKKYSNKSDKKFIVGIFYKILNYSKKFQRQNR